MAGELMSDFGLFVTAMILAGVAALRGLCPFDSAFPFCGEDEAVEAILKAALEAQCLGVLKAIENIHQMIALMDNILA